jgi:hypothetical protein
MMMCGSRNHSAVRPGHEEIPIGNVAMEYELPGKKEM